MASVVPNSFKGRLLGDTAQIATAINLATDTVKAMLLTASHTNDVDAQVFISDVSANECPASGTYSAGGATLTKTSSTDDTNDRGALDATDLSFTSATLSARYLAVYKDTGTPATSPIICIVDFGSTIVSTAGTFAVTFHANGILTLS